MELNFDDIWVKVLDIIKKELNPVSFSTWFSDTKIHDITNEKIYLLVPMPLHKRMFQSNYFDIINEAFSSVLGEDKEFECLLEEEINDKVTTLVEEVVDNIQVINKVTNTKHESNLNKSLNFDNFVVGDTNKFARTAALAVAQNPGVQYNPLFIYGKVG